MSKEEIIEMVVRELTEKALEDRRESLSEEEQQLYIEVGKLSERARDIFAKCQKTNSRLLMTTLSKPISLRTRNVHFSICRVQKTA